MTTAVGGIKLDLAIDGSAVPKDVTDAVQKQLKPILSDATKAVQGLSAALNNVGAGAGIKDTTRDVGKAKDAFAGFTEAVLREVRPALDQVNREIDQKMQAAEQKMRTAGGNAGRGFSDGMGEHTKTSFGSIGDIAIGSFLGSMGAQLLTKGMAIFEDFARRGADAIGSVLQGGWDRLTSIDTAKTKMEALGMSTQNISYAMDSALKAVKGTAFGLQDAATVAASAIAAGVQPGEQLTKYLTLTADAASIAAKSGQDMGVAFNDMGHILNKVTTQGYATNEELQQISDAGIPIYQKLGTNLNKTAGEIVGMAEKSGVAASAIRSALEDIVGGAAQTMGTSFEGATQNVGAAFDRLGAALLQPFFDPAKDGVFTLTTAIDDLTEVVKVNQPEIVNAVRMIGDVFIVMAEAAALQTSMTAGSFAIMTESIAGTLEFLGHSFDVLRKPLEYIPDTILGTVSPAMLELKRHGEEISAGLHDAAKSTDETAESMFGFGKDAMDLATNTMPKLNETFDQYMTRLGKLAEGNAAFAESTKNMSTAIVNSLDPIIYQARTMLWVQQVQQFAASGGKGTPPGPAPVWGPTVPGWTPAAIPPSIASSGPPDTTKPSSGGGGKDDKPPLYAGGVLPPVNVAVPPGIPGTNVPALAAAIPALGSDVLGSGFLRDVEGRHSGPQSVSVASMIHQMFPQIPYIGGARASGTAPNTHDTGTSIDIPISASDMGTGDAINQYLLSNAQALGIVYTIWRNKGTHTGIGGRNTGTFNQPGHMDHIDVHFDGGGTMSMGPQGTSIVYPGQMPGIPDMSGIVPGVGTWSPADPKQLREANDRIIDLENQIRVKEQRMREMRADVAESEKMAAEAERNKLYRDLDQAKADKATLEQGKFSTSKSSSLSYKDFPLGDPRRIMAGVLGGLGMPGDEIGQLIGSVGAPLGQVAGGAIAAASSVQFPGLGTPTAPQTDLNTLIQQGNPLALAQAAGVNVPDYSRSGGDPSAQNLMANGGPAADAMGRIYSDTAALVDRTFTNLDAAEKARHDQVMTVLNEVATRLGVDVLAPVVQKGVTAGVDGLGTGTTEAIGEAMAQPIAAAVADAVPAGSGAAPSAGSQIATATADAIVHGAQAAMAPGPAGFVSFEGNAGFGPLFNAGGSIVGNLYDEGGLWPSGTFGTNLSGRPERVLDPDQTRLFDAGLLGGWNLQPLQQNFATVSGVDASSTVGADFFGVSQVPIIGAIVNLLVAVLLKVIGVQVEARDTLDEISSEFRDFRGDFQAFDAAGRLMNDTSGLLDRTGTSEQAAVDERIRILKQVLEGLIKFIIEKIIVPIGKAVAQTAISIGAQAAQGAITGGITAALPTGGSVIGGMVGSVVSSAISSAGNAAVDIIAEVGTILAESLISVGLDAIGSLFQSYLPGLANTLFGGGLLAAVIDPITSALNGVLGGVSMLFGGLFGGLATLIPGLPFDDGGLAVGMGWMPKATIQPERVLSPRQTDLYDRHVSALEAGAGTSTTTNHVAATIHVAGGPHAGERVRDSLLSLID